MALSQGADILLKNYITIDTLSSPDLMKYCINNPDLEIYIPDCPIVDTIGRDFLVKVNFINNYFSNILKCNTTILKLSPFNSFTLSPLKKLLIKSTVKLLPPVSMEPLKVLVLSFLHSNLKKLDKFIKKLKSQNTS